MIKLRLEGTQKEINSFLRRNNLTDSAKEKIKSISKFYPDRGMAEIESEEGRVYIELE